MSNVTDFAAEIAKPERLAQVEKVRRRSSLRKVATFLEEADRAYARAEYISLTLQRSGYKKMP